MTLVELVQERGVVLERRGNRWWAKCPFHQDTAPSFTISEKDHSQVWYCYGCKRGGGPIQFLMEMDQLAEWEARRVWNKINGFEPPLEDREILLKFIEELTYHEYLSQRGITEATAKRFKAGYCENYQEILSKIGVGPARASEIGLWDVSESIVYPFFDKEGVYKVAARSVKEKVYKTSPETARFFKIGLWGLQLLRGKEAWIFEGYHDAMVAWQAGYPALAACGTNMKAEQWQELQSAGINRVVFVPDGDAAGKAWLESLARAAPRNLSLEFIELSFGDPDDEILKNGNLDHLKRWNVFEWFITSKYGSPSTVADHIRMLQDSGSVFLRMPEIDKAVARHWYKRSFADDESLSYLAGDVKPDVNAERVCLANCIYSNTARLETVQQLEVGYFTGQLHQKLFQMMDKEITPQMVWVECGEDLSDYADIVNYKLYIDKVKHFGQSQKIAKILRQCDVENPGEIIEQIYKATDKSHSISGEELVHRVADGINYRVQNPGIPGVEIPAFPMLNRSLLGLQPEKYLLISGNSGHGKTTTLCNIMNEVIDDYPSLMFSLEMTDEEIVQKLVAIRSGIPSVKMVTGSLEQAEYEEVMKAVDSFMHGNLEIVTGVSDLRKIMAIAKSHVLRRGVRFVFIDYLQLITMQGSRDERWEQLISISNGVKEISRMGVTVIALSQLAARALSGKGPVESSDQAGSYGILAPVDYAVTVQKQTSKEGRGSNYLMNVSKSRFGWDNIQIECVFDRGTQRIREQI